jgi:hypothetical protein
MNFLEANPFDNLPEIVDAEEVQESSSKFIEANTKEVQLSHLQNKCIIPVFAKDNESTISHQDFINVVSEVAQTFYKNEHVMVPAIRVSHPIKGRIPGADRKAAHLLEDHEKTIYYERMAFMIEIPSITSDLSGNRLSLTVGGVRAYNHENLYNRKVEERFKIFVGYKNSVCTNLCVSTDGFKDDVRVRSLGELYSKMFELLDRFDGYKQLTQLSNFDNYALSESQFAQLIGRSRMYHFLPGKDKVQIPAMPLSDTQITSVTREYYNDESFCCNSDGAIDLWKFYNLLTGSNKSSYIDSFLQRGVGCSNFASQLVQVLQNNHSFWYLN